MDYTSVTFSLSGAQEHHADLIINDLSAIGFDTFEEQENGFVAYIPTATFNEADMQALLAAYAGELKYTYVVKEIEQENWNEVWESNFSPLIIDDTCYVRATFHEPQPQYKYEIVIDPKMSFGTGHHQTTTMMMQYLLETDCKNKEVLDMGCGTAILAILAAKLGATKLMAIDYDPICYDSTLENVSLNGTNNIDALCGSKEVIPDAQYDIILANINRNILLDQIHRYAEVLKSKGQIFFSGFYEDPDLQMIKDECSKYGLEYVNHKKINEWVAASFVNGK